MTDDLQKEITNPLVSVTILVFNSASSIAETLNSVIAQTHENIEIIIVNDGSTDQTLDVLKQYASNVNIINQNNQGLASGRNAGCHAATGKYIALMDADDICMPERIAIQVACLEQHPEIVMCSSDFSAFNSNGVIADSYIRSYYSQVADAPGGIAGIYPHREDIFLEGGKITTHSGYLYEKMILGSFVHPPTVLFRRSILDECGLADEHIVNCCDF